MNGYLATSSSSAIGLIHRRRVARAGGASTSSLDRVYGARRSGDGPETRHRTQQPRHARFCNCHISDIKAVGQDSQALGGFNGPGNYLIENNYLEAAAENFLLGGADPPIPGLITSNVVVPSELLEEAARVAQSDHRRLRRTLPLRLRLARARWQRVCYAYKVVARAPAGQDD